MKNYLVSGNFRVKKFSSIQFMQNGVAAKSISVKSFKEFSDREIKAIYKVSELLSPDGYVVTFVCEQTPEFIHLHEDTPTRNVSKKLIANS